jgi:hypothetical protein
MNAGQELLGVAGFRLLVSLAVLMVAVLLVLWWKHRR